MKCSIITRQTKAGTAFDLYVRWIGQRYRPLLGYNLTKDQAEEVAIAMIAKIQAQPATPDGRQDKRTLRDLVPLFWDNFTVKKRVDHTRPKGILENHLLPAFGDRLLVSLTAKDGLDYGMTANYSHGGPAWDQKLREAVTKLDSFFKMSYGWSTATA